MISTTFPLLASTNPYCILVHTADLIQYCLTNFALFWNTLCLVVPRRVTEIEAQRLEETREDREAFKKMLREEIERQAREKNVSIKLPDDK